MRDKVVRKGWGAGLSRYILFLGSLITLTAARAANPGDEVIVVYNSAMPGSKSLAEYYAQRASAGLIIGEATAISPEGFGWADTPGLWTAEQVHGWHP